MKKKYFRFLSLAFFLVGIFFLLNSKTDITGAVVGISNISSGLSSIFGIALILVSVILLAVNKDLEELLGIHDFKSDEDYQKLKRGLETRGERIIKKETKGNIEFKDYQEILEKNLYDSFPTKMKGSYKSDREEYFGRKRESPSEANKYLSERLKDINKDSTRVSELTGIKRTKGKIYDEKNVKSVRDYLIREYRDKNIDETEFADKLNKEGEFTGGVYNPGKKQLSVKVMGHPIKIPRQGNNQDLARAIHAKILSNSPSYKPDCEFHYSKKESTKHHTKGL
jgi:hypothetical protein